MDKLPIVEILKCVADTLIVNGCEDDGRDVEQAAKIIVQLYAALNSVEGWWLSEGMQHFDGAPAAIFAVRAALEKVRSEK